MKRLTDFMNFKIHLLTYLVFILLSTTSCQSPGAQQKPVVKNEQPSTFSTEQGRSLALQLSEAFEEAANKVSPAIVPIFAEQVVEVTNPFGSQSDPFRDFFGDDFFKRFFGTPRKEGQKQTIKSLGSGVIVSADGYILTNNHVIGDADKLTVILHDEKKYTAKVVGADPQTDVAVIKIDANDLPTVVLGNSDNVRIGQWVIAVGNPFQLMHTVTAGIISAKGRSSVGLADYEDFIQTDAAINPGNSGGALADLDGNVIAINTAISSPSGGNVGIGFAIPINMAKKVMDELIDKGKVSRGYLGLYPQNIDDNLAKAMKLKSTEGSLVADIVPGGPAEKAGIKRGDIIIKINKQKVKNSEDLRNMVAATKPGTKVNISLLRDGKELKINLILNERPNQVSKETPEEKEKSEQNYQKLGLQVQTLTPDIAKQLGYKNDHGVVVTNVVAGSAAEEAKLQQGDLIIQADHTLINSVAQLSDKIKELKSEDSIALLVKRNQNTFYTAIQMP